MNPTLQTLTLRRPDDWHLHVRDGAQLEAVVPFTARQFGRALVMPNLQPPMTTTDALAGYRARILAAVPAGLAFEPQMTLYLTDSTSPDEIRRAQASGFVVGAKLYPAGATTHSDAGVTAIDKVWPALEAMAEHGLVLQVHGEVTASDVDVFDREQVFIDRVLSRVVERVPRLKVVFEHITTRIAAEFVQSARAGVAATITPQHLLLNRNALFAGGIRPHHYCLPVLKRERDREALLAAATSDDPRFFLGTDSAPHARHTKENACGCAGIFSAHAAIELYAEAFESAGKLDRLEAFASERGADFYGIPRNTGTLTLRKESWNVPDSYAFGPANESLVPFRAGATLAWRMLDPA
ncbi:MAG: dihydroorotase [Steroidobacteraceae bacterium]|nr:dihydroorotase [Steroidobacteraceae bacterium]MBP9129300.1 dihydroorotase [Steroidobacteraceae bacterium]